MAASAYLAWSCLSVVFLEAVPSSGYESASFLYVSGAFVIAISIWLSNNRRARILNKSEDNLGSDYEVELKVRVVLHSKNAFWTQKSTVLSGAKPDKIDDTYRWANQVFTQGLKKFPNSSYLYTAYATFLYGKCNFNYALTVFSKAKRSAVLDFDVAFQMFKMSRLIEHIFSQQKGSLEVKNYFSFLSLSRQTEQAQSRFIAKKLMFLAELRKTPPQPKRLQIMGREFRALLETIQTNYYSMFTLNASAKVLRQYATFLSNVLAAPQMVKAVVARADQLDLETENAESKHKNIGLESQAALFDERNAVFVISGDENNLGEILEVNLGGVDMFGFTASSEIVGTNISSMMPTPFSGNPIASYHFASCC